MLLVSDIPQCPPSTPSSKPFPLCCRHGLSLESKTKKKKKNQPFAVHRAKYISHPFVGIIIPFISEKKIGDQS